jgi:cellulose synthase/poly-beta-1,6-N-acetylglucosamine synthase-like glycosyltransferase
MRVASTPRPSGAAAARNVGWRLAGAPVVAFTDDDCRPAQGWLAALARAMTDADVVQGVTTFDPAEAAGRGAFSQVVKVPAWSGQFETSNVAYRAELLARLGGFDEHFGGDSFGEDVDLGWRALDGGARTAFADDAVVVHDVKRGPWLAEARQCVRGARRWRHLGRLLRDHPGYREVRLEPAPFLNAAHPPTWVAIAGLGLLAVRPRRRWARRLAALSLLPWVRHRAVVEPRPGNPRHLPATLPVALLVDVTRVLTVAGSAVRYRTLVL